MVNPDRIASRLAGRATERSEERPTERKFQRPQRGMTAAEAEVDQSRVPRGYIMEFKRHTIYGAQDRRNQALVRQYGWEPVTNEMQPHFAGPGADPKAQVTRGSDALYMRPAYLNDEAHEEHSKDTDDVLRNQLMALKQESKGNVGEKNTYVKRQTVAVPADSN
jgi:hypothetical protein